MAGEWGGDSLTGSCVFSAFPEAASLGESLYCQGTMAGTSRKDTMTFGEWRNGESKNSLAFQNQGPWSGQG